MGCLTHLKSTVSVKMFLTCVNSLGTSNLSEIIRPVQFPDITLPFLTSTEVWWELLPKNSVPLCTRNPCKCLSTYCAHRQQLSGSNFVKNFRRQWRLYISQLNISHVLLKSWIVTFSLEKLSHRVVRRSTKYHHYVLHTQPLENAFIHFAAVRWINILQVMKMLENACMV